MSALKSVCRRQMILVIMAPTNAIDETGAARRLHVWGNKVIMRTSPYPPSFSRMAARIIEPATGASTWALGSHRCTENRGNFTRNAAVMKNLVK